jgi:hypothetical protein
MPQNLVEIWVWQKIILKGNAMQIVKGKKIN